MVSIQQGATGACIIENGATKDNGDLSIYFLAASVEGITITHRVHFIENFFDLF